MTLEQQKAEMLVWQSAVNAHDAGDFIGSLRLFEPIAETAKIFINIALIHDRLGQQAEAIENLTRAVELDKYLAIGYFQRGVSYFHQGQYAEAVQDFTQAQTMMRTSEEIDYDNLGLNYKLKSREILFNKWLALLKASNEREAAAVLREIMEGAPPELETAISKTQKSPAHAVPFSLPTGTLYRPSAQKMQQLTIAVQSMNTVPKTPVQTPRTRRNLPSLRTASSDTSSTLAPSISSRKTHRKYNASISSTMKASPILEDPPDMTSVVHVPKRTELNRVIGADLMKPIHEIHGIPCAGVRISHGSLTGLMAWRFVVGMEGFARSSVVANFILDTGNKDSYIPSEVLAALGYRGNMNPGAEVTVRIQNVKTKCIVAHPEDAGRVGISFMTAGSLTYYFDSGLVAPVLYDGSRERPADVPRTIRAEDLPRRSWLSRILSFFTRRAY